MIVRSKELTMQSEKQKLLIFGLGYFGKAFLKTLSTEWAVTGVDINESRIDYLQGKIPGVEYHNGAAASLSTWKKLNLDKLKYIISTLRDKDVNIELCRIARETFNLKIPIIILVDQEVDEKIFAPFNARLVNPLQPGIYLLLKELGKGVIPAANMGLRKGEIIEVSIKARSHLVDRKLKYLKPKQWHISALYRDDKLILPEGNCSLKVGDRAVLVGEPKVLEQVTTILLKGLPQFPLQYGNNIVFPLHKDFDCNMDEVVYWLNSFKSQHIHFIPFRKKLSHQPSCEIKTDVKNYDIGQPIELFKEIFMLSLDTGVLVLPSWKGSLKYSRIWMAFKKSRKPFLLSRLTFPYEGVVISFNGPDPVQAMQTGIEIAKLLDKPYRVVYVTLPKEMRGKEEDERIRLRRDIISDFEGIYEKSIDYEVLEGNPVRQTLTYLKPMKMHLLVIVTNPLTRVSIFTPHVPYLVAKKTLLSTLVIPETETNE
ncbi:MAG: NAD-binding protein [Candidatus Aminicenantes bacterium]|nr:MAG: NAD-binding protein [Candidatus Aminicenantes bacterium]